MDISMDFIMGLPKAQGYNAIFVICDRFTKQVHIIPTMKEMNSLGLACLYQDCIWKLHGLPNTVISNCGPQFMLSLIKYWELKQNYQLHITCRLMDRQRG